jgi:hypothetical protein
MATNQEFARVRRTIRQTVIATAIGASFGAAAVIAVVAAAVAVLDRTPADHRKAETAAPAPHRTAAAATATPSPAQQSAAAPEQKDQRNPCEVQTWPYYDAACLTRLRGGRDAAALGATAPIPYLSAQGELLALGATTATVAPAASAPAPAASAPPSGVQAAPTTAQPSNAQAVAAVPEPSAPTAAEARPKPKKKTARRSRHEPKNLARDAPQPAAEPDATNGENARAERARPERQYSRGSGDDEFSARTSYAPEAGETREDRTARTPARTRNQKNADRTRGKSKYSAQVDSEQDVPEADGARWERGRSDRPGNFFFGGSWGESGRDSGRDSWRDSWRGD